jgi:hypothetical protein
VRLALAIVMLVATAARADDRAALDFWHKLAPTWSKWRQQRKTIPPERERELARAILRGGNFACPVSKPSPPECEHELRFPVRTPAPNAGFDDPCMRHVLLTWALRMLSEDDLAAMRDDLIPLVTMPAPENDIARELIDRVATVDNDTALPLIIAAGRARTNNPATFDTEIDRARPSAWPQLRAARLYRSTPFQRDASETAWILEEAADPLVSSNERIWAMRTIVEMLGAPSPPALAAIAKLAADPDCRVAEAAAVLVAAAGDPSLLPSRTRDTDPAVNARAICMASQDISYLDHGSGVANQMRSVLASYAAADIGELVRCDGTRCVGEGHSVQLQFHAAADGVVLASPIVVAATCNDFDRDFDDFDFDLDDAYDASNKQ